MDSAQLSAIIHRKRAITEEIALDFADALGTSPEFWMGLQTDINLWEARTETYRKSDLLEFESRD